ncbi:hypothetical protein Leryth_017352 [Lithospermum erythrorhizon]|uniref:B3 domain-containing protein n=1 Tax=Lithospermum erythrorhizon TaxID=34254 RepID=A0AAV3QJ12_LITER|nr:hypothetical protein Leryth_017352 [Lithospermum erythrorhizon]
MVHKLTKKDEAFMLDAFSNLGLEKFNELLEKYIIETKNNDPLEASIPPFPKTFPKKKRSASVKNKEKKIVPVNYEKEGRHKLAKTVPVPYSFNNYFDGETSVTNYFDHENETKLSINNNGSDAKKRKKEPKVDGPNPPPRMPEIFRTRISQIIGKGKDITEEKLVVQRKLETTDCKGAQNRFNIPNGKLIEEFLKEHEKGVKKKQVNIIDPSLNKHQIVLSLWNEKNKPYNVLNGPSWMNIIEGNGLSRGMILQLWAVRVDNDELWFVLVNLTPTTEELAVETTATFNDCIASPVEEGTTPKDMDYEERSSSSDSSVGTAEYYLN